MAATNGYTPEQASDLYITDGTIDDWLWGDAQDLRVHLRDVPGRSGGGGFYPPDEVIAAQTTRNREAVLMLCEYADCPYRAIGKQAQYCGGGAAAPPSARTLRDRHRLDHQPERHRHRDHRRVGAR